MAEKLVKARFFSLTGDDNKDHDTGVFVTVSTNDTATVLAVVHDADNSGDDSTEYNDHSPHIVDLVIMADGATTAQCANFKFKVGVRAHGNDKWKVDKASVTLYFDNGQTLYQETGHFELESKGSNYTESGWFGGN